jgi:exonuclease SbcD
MRILHTADWHIGQTLNGWTREAEHRAFLRELPELADAYAVDRF